MRAMRLLQLLVFAFLAILFVTTSFSSACPLILLKETDTGVIMEKVQISEDEVTVFERKDFISFIIPLGVGQSGDLVKSDIRIGAVTARCIAGELSIEKDDGEKIFPAVKIEDLAKYDVRVNITGGNGLQKAFFISRYDEFEIDDGPVIDMFAGMIPMEEGDYSITIEISEAKELPQIAGEAKLLFRDGWLFMKGELSDGSSGYFIVDFGAGATVVAKDFLPNDANIEEVKGVEYSDKGMREVKGEMGGLGGGVSGFLGNATLDELTFGSIRFSDITVRIIDELPELGSLPIVGIVGLDLLRRADLVSFGYSANEPSLLEMTSRDQRSIEDARSAEIQFSVVANHIFIEGALNDVPVLFVFDTGARSSLISSTIAEKAGLKSDENDTKQFRGLDGNPIEFKSATGERLQLGSSRFHDVKLYSAHLPVLQSMGLDQDGGIIGNDFLEKFDRVEVDFSRGIIVLQQ